MKSFVFCLWVMKGMWQGCIIYFGSTPRPGCQSPPGICSFSGSGILKNFHLWLASWVKGNPKWAGCAREGLVNPALKIFNLARWQPAFGKFFMSIWSSSSGPVSVHADLQPIIFSGYKPWFVFARWAQKTSYKLGWNGGPISRIQRDPMQTHEFWGHL